MTNPYHLHDLVSGQLVRKTRLEGATVANRSADGTLDLVAGNRPAARTKIAPGGSSNAAQGDRVLFMTSGDNDKPVAICDNPWLF